MAIKLLNNSSHTFIITDASIKNNIAISISYVYIHNKPLIKTLHYAINIMNTEVKLLLLDITLIKLPILLVFPKLLLSPI